MSGSRYDTLLADMPGIETPVIAKDNTSVYAQYTILAVDTSTISTYKYSKIINTTTMKNRRNNGT